MPRKMKNMTVDDITADTEVKYKAFQAEHSGATPSVAVATLRWKGEDEDEECNRIGLHPYPILAGRGISDDDLTYNAESYSELIRLCQSGSGDFAVVSIDWFE